MSQSKKDQELARKRKSKLLNVRIIPTIDAVLLIKGTKEQGGHKISWQSWKVYFGKIKFYIAKGKHTGSNVISYLLEADGNIVLNVDKEITNFNIDKVYDIEDDDDDGADITINTFTTGAWIKTLSKLQKKVVSKKI